MTQSEGYRVPGSTRMWSACREWTGKGEQWCCGQPDSPTGVLLFSLRSSTKTEQPTPCLVSKTKPWCHVQTYPGSFSVFIFSCVVYSLFIFVSYAYLCLIHFLFCFALLCFSCLFWLRFFFFVSFLFLVFSCVFCSCLSYYTCFRVYCRERSCVSAWGSRVWRRSM